MNDKKIEPYQSFVDYLNNASKEDLQKLANAIQESLSQPKNPSKIVPEPYQSFVDSVSNASKEELQKLAEALQGIQSKDLIYSFIKDIKNDSLNVDTNEEVKKR